MIKAENSYQNKNMVQRNVYFSLFIIKFFYFDKVREQKCKNKRGSCIAVFLLALSKINIFLE